MWLALALASGLLVGGPLVIFGIRVAEDVGMRLRARKRRKLRPSLHALACAAALLLLAGGASAQQGGGSPSQCGPVSVGTGAVAMTFPASGASGPAYPLLYLTIHNPSATATLWVNPMPGGTAAANTAGSFAIGPLAASLVWSAAQGVPPPRSLSIVASASSSPVTCAYQ